MYASTDEQYLQPDEVVSEIRGQSSDINAGFGGKYVWLHPEWTSVKDEAMSNLSFKKSSTPVRNYNDLAMGAGGNFRYIQASRGGSEGITKVGLFRVKQQLPPDEIQSRIEQSGFTHYSSDMNEGRSGDYLYLLWAY
ncbi:hypothetical protein F5B17DRAFT_185212 [Nemania serpens]|nr:hypothetical protein F5B17DRAFT_185212 [Nemania serpens]